MGSPEVHIDRFILTTPAKNTVVRRINGVQIQRHVRSAIVVRVAIRVLDPDKFWPTICSRGTVSLVHNL
jgi:hypothetical protein